MEKYFKFSASDDSDWLWGYAVGGGKCAINDSTDITMNTIKKVDVNEATRTLMNWLYNDCNITADRDYVAKAVSRAFERGHYVMEFDSWWDGYYEEFCECTLEATENPLTDWEEVEDGLDEVKADKGPYTGRDAINGEAPYHRAERLWKEATGKEPTIKLAGLTNQKKIIYKDGSYTVIDVSRSDEEIKDAIRNFLA